MNLDSEEFHRRQTKLTLVFSFKTIFVKDWLISNGVLIPSQDSFTYIEAVSSGIVVGTEVPGENPRHWQTFPHQDRP